MYKNEHFIASEQAQREKKIRFLDYKKNIYIKKLKLTRNKDWACSQAKHFNAIPLLRLMFLLVPSCVIFVCLTVCQIHEGVFQNISQGLVYGAPFCLMQ